MDIKRIIEELCEERARLDEVIISLEKLSPTRRPRRGRPPAWTRVASVTAPQSLNGH